LTADALRGARIGVDPQFFDLEKNFSPPSDAPLFDLDAMLAAMRAGGATIVRGVDVGDFYNLLDPEFTVLLYEFKTQIAEYLATRGNTSMRTLSDLIAFNKRRCAVELKYFGQEVFEAAQTTGSLNDQAYLDAVRECRRLARRDGLDRAFAEHNLDVIVAPTWSFIGTPAAVAGYPNISIPAGFTGNGRPYGASIVALAWQEPKLLGIAHAVEQAMDLRRQPTFKGSVPPEPPHFPGCADDSASASAVAPTVDSRARRLL
jgi:amidase